MPLPIRWGTEFRINGTLTSAQYDSALVGSVSGQFFALFTDLSGGNTNVRARYFDAAGASIAADFVVNDVVSFNEDTAAAAGVANGTMLAVWTDDSQSLTDTSATAIHAQLLLPSGAASGTEFVVNTTTADAQLNPAIAGLSNNRFLVSWEDQGSNSLRAQIVSSSGAKIGAEIDLRSGVSATVDTAVASLASGGAFVAWTETNAGMDSLDDSGSGIVAQLIDQNGAKVGGPFLVNATTADFQISPEAAALSDGKVAIVWTDASASGSDTSGFALRARVFNADGAPATAEFLVNTTTAGDQSEPAIAALPGGRFVVAWTDASATGGDTSDQAVRARVFDSAGAPDSDEFLVNLTSTGRQAEPAIAVLADGRFVISWTDESESFGDMSDSAIVGQIFDPRTAAVTLPGTGFNDDLVGTVFADQLSGGLGNDRLQGVDSNDMIDGGDGNDFIAGGGGGDSMDGGAGTFDALDYSASGAGVSVNLATGAASGGDAAGDTFVNFERVIGSAFADILTGGAGVQRLDGNGGDDTLRGGAGGDFINGGGGNDTLTFGGSLAGVTVNLTTGTGLGGDAQGDTYSGIDKVLGTNFADTLTGNAFANTLNTGGGTDTINGEGGNDTMNGGTGTDTLNGGAGRDIQIGGADADIFVFSATSHSAVGGQRDVVSDFVQAQLDKIDVSAIDAMAGAGGNNAFSQFIGATAFSAEGQIRAYQVGTSTIIEFNTTGASGAEMQIALTNFTAANLTLADFLA